MPESTAGPYRSATTFGLSFVGSATTRIGSRTVTVSPEVQERVRVAYVPGVVAMFCWVPLTLTVAPWVQPGMRIRIVHEPPTLPVTVSVLVSLAGKLVDWVTVMPRWDQVSTEGMKRFTVSVLPLWK